MQALIALSHAWASCSSPGVEGSHSADTRQAPAAAAAPTEALPATEVAAALLRLTHPNRYHNHDPNPSPNPYTNPNPSHNLKLYRSEVLPRCFDSLMRAGLAPHARQAQPREFRRRMGHEAALATLLRDSEAQLSALFERCSGRPSVLAGVVGTPPRRAAPYARCVSPEP